MLADGVDEDWSYLVSFFLAVLEERIGVGVEAMFVGGVFRERIVDEHIEDEEVDHCFLPSDRSMRVDQMYSVKSVIFYFA